MAPAATNSTRYIDLLRLRSERRMLLIMSLAMSGFALLWSVWCAFHGLFMQAWVPMGYILVALSALVAIRYPGTERWGRHLLLLAGILLPFVFQATLGGLAKSGMVMLWSLPSLVAAVNVARGSKRYGYILLIGACLSLFALHDPVLFDPFPMGARDQGLLLAFNLSASMCANFFLADRMLNAQRLLRKRLLDIQHEAEERALRTLEERNTEMQQSLDYAGRIQMALWPDQGRMSGLFDRMIVHYCSKEAVGGDLIWHARVDDRSYFMVIDCTGHGVPGSLMSMLIHGLLNEIVHTYRNLSAAQLLRRAQQLLSDRLDRERTGNTDGAEMAVLCFEHSTNRVTCSGLGCGIIVQQEEGMHHFRSHSSNASLLTEMRLNALKEHVITITPSTRLFMYTDGMVDQFCAKDQRKFNRSRLETTLTDAAHLHPEAQMQHLLHVFDEWKGTTPLIDDVLLVSLVPAHCWHTRMAADQGNEAAA
jgi:serine phosphatase RsbU (regulator of sigma subunit)